METNRLIIELVRDRLRAAREEQLDLTQQYSQAMGSWKMRQTFEGFTKDGETVLFDEEEFNDVSRRYEVELRTMRLAIESWERALTLALDKLF